MSICRSRLGNAVLTLLIAVPVGLISAAGAAKPADPDRPAAVVADPAPEPRTLPAEARAMLTARQTGRRVELTAARTEMGQVFANPDGSKTMEQHPQPVRVRTGTGWAAPDPTLRRLPDGTVRPVATATPMVLSGGGSSALLTIGGAGRQVRMGWPGRLPGPILDGATATYPEVLPGVDLRVQIGIDGFSHLLVVKDRKAASNPALRTLRYPVSATGLKLAVGADHSLVASDERGTPVFSAPSAVMWDASARRAGVGLSLAAGRELVLTPNRAMLADPAARFPLFIDPSLSGKLVNWLHVNVQMGNQSAWTYDRNDEGAKVGRAYGATEHLYRSMFLLRTTNGDQTIAGSTILGATFRITLNKTPSGTPTPVQLRGVRGLDPASYLDWGTQTQSGFWGPVLSTANGEAYPWTEDNPMEFESAALLDLVKNAAASRAPTISLGLRAQDENNQYQWKKFHPSSAVLSITYNNTPRTPRGLTMTRPKPCGTAEAPTPIATRAPQFSAVADDPDTADLLTSTLRIHDPAGTAVHTSQIANLVSGAAFSWPEVPAGRLADGVVYRYSAITSDAQVSSPATAYCYFVIDSVAPLVPRIESTAFPDGQPVTPVRTTGTVTFRPGSTDTDVAEYVYGFAQSKLTMRVKAGPDGSATVPITVWPNDVGLPERRLWVQAVDRAGNLSPGDQPAWDLVARDDGPPARNVRGDSNGDGRADVTAVFDHGYGRSAVWNVTSADSGFHNAVIGWDSGEGSGFAFFRTRPVQGDWDGDGRTDMAMFREGAGRQVWLYQLTSDGNRYDATPHVWTSGPNGWALNTVKITAGDVDGDRKDDIVVQRPGSGDEWTALVFLAADNFSSPVTWTTAAPGNSAVHSAPVLADVDGDNRADLVSIRNLGDCRTAIDLYRSTGSAFAAATRVYDSSGYCWEKSKAVVADPDGDGRDDVLALYENQDSASLVVFQFSGTTMTKTEWHQAVGLDLSKATLAAGDYDGDGKDDAALLYACCQDGDRQVMTFHSTGTAFADRVTGWQGPVDAVPGPKFDIEHRQYELVNRNSGKCLAINTYVADAQMVQYDCDAAATVHHPSYRRMRLMAIPGTAQYSVRPVVTGSTMQLQCVGVPGRTTADDAAVVHEECGSGNGEPTADQQVTVDYVDGSGYDTVVQLRFAHSGKCAQVRAGGTADGDPLTQLPCGQGADQQWILRPAFNGTQLGEDGAARYKITAATGARVLDVKDCSTADSADLRMWDWSSTRTCQRWRLESVGDDIYKIVNAQSGKPLDIRGCSKLPRGIVEPFASNASACQLWRIEPALPVHGGGYSVIAVSSGLSLEIAGCSSALGADVITGFYRAPSCQRWIFTKL